jgi:hypothetical protein
MGLQLLSHLNWSKDFKNLLPITKRPTFEYYSVELWLLKSYNYQRIWFQGFQFRISTPSLHLFILFFSHSLKAKIVKSTTQHSNTHTKTSNLKCSNVYTLNAYTLDLKHSQLEVQTSHLKCSDLKRSNLKRLYLKFTSQTLHTITFKPQMLKLRTHISNIKRSDLRPQMFRTSYVQHTQSL